MNKLYRRNNNGVPTVWWAELDSGTNSITVFYGLVRGNIRKEVYAVTQKDGQKELESRYNDKIKQGYTYLNELCDMQGLPPVEDGDNDTLFNFLNTYLPKDLSNGNSNLLLPMLAKTYSGNVWKKVSCMYGHAVDPAGRSGGSAASRAVPPEAGLEGHGRFAGRPGGGRRRGRGRIAGLRCDAAHRRRAGRAAARQHRHVGAGDAQRQPAVDLHPRAGRQQAGAALPGRRPWRQPTGHGALRSGRPGGALRRGQLGAARRRQVLRRRGPSDSHAGALHRGRPRPGAVPAPALRPGQGLCAGRVLGQRAGHPAGAELPGAVPRLCGHRPDGGLPGERPDVLRLCRAVGTGARRHGEGGQAGRAGPASLLRRWRSLERVCVLDGHL